MQFCLIPFSVWDPNGGPDFSQCFEESILAVIPNAIFLLFAVFRLRYLHNRPTLVVPLDSWHLRTNKLITSVTVIVAFIAIILNVAVVNSNQRSGSSILSAVFYFVGSLAAVAVLVLEHTRFYRASTGLMLYWLFSFWVWIIRVRTLYNLEQANAITAFSIIQLILTAFAFILENFTFIPDESGRRVRPSPLGSNVNVFARISYWYMQPLMILGSRRELTIADLWRPDNNQTSAAILKKFNIKWKKEIERSKLYKTNPQILRSIIYAFHPSLLVGLAHYAINFTCSFLEPILLQSMLTFIATPTQSYIGYVIAVAIFLNAITSVITNVQLFIAGMSVGYQVRSSLCSAIFRKSLNLTNTSRQSTSTGQINNMLAADTNHIMWFMTMAYDPVGIPVKIVAALYLLWQQLGAACLGGLAVTIIAFPLQAFIGKQLMHGFDVKQARGDTRIEIVNESLTSIKLLKLYGWDLLFHQRVSQARQEELKSIKSIGIWKSFDTFVSTVTPLFVSLTSFAIFSAVNSGTGQVLDATRIFVSLSLFNILAQPIQSIGFLFSGGSAAYISLQRMRDFLLLEELDETNVEREISSDGNVVHVENGSFKWDSASSEKILENINFVIKKGSLAAVIGRVGTGKSSLISTLLGEMYKESGKVRVSGSIAYVSQQAWIENATVRDNILFGSEYDEAKFSAIIDACALRNDLKLLTAGDLTEIGEKGVNLSGGQKQRLALARAVYNDAEIYILDDALSAVDAHVDKHIFDNVLGPRGLLSNKTRIFVTHGVHHLPACDSILVVKDKTVVQQGSYDELMAIEGGTFKILIDEFAHDVSVETFSDSTDVDTNSLEKKLDIVDDAFLIATEKHQNVFAEDGKLMKKEDAGKGLAKTSVFIAYARAAGIIWIVISFSLLTVGQIATVGTGIWLDNWSSNAGDDSGHSNGYYLGIYGTLVVVASSLILLTNLTMYIKVGQNAAKVMHSSMLKGVLHAPMSFFDTNPLGRITNRFVGDIQVVDEQLVETYVIFLTYLASSISTIIIICSITPLFLTLILPIIGFYYYIQNYYLRTAQAIQRISRLTNSPVYALANTTFTGISTVRAFDKSLAYQEKNNILQDDMQTSFLSQMAANKWLQLRLEGLGAFITFGAALFAVVERNTISAGSVGLSLGYALQLTQYLYHTMRMFGNVQNSGVSLERIFEYFNLASEAAQHTTYSVPKDWPQEGKIVFKDLNMRYREETPLILNGISFNINGGEKVGIVGRTGAGKSSLSVALFRLVEAERGTIKVDGVDIAKIGLNLLRTRFTIIPQEPVLFGASVRDNIDPEHEHSDETIWRALDASYLKERFSGHEDGLEQKIKSGGDNMSVGERQLFCLARAILRNTKVLVLDEATAGIDLETDSLIQATIRNEFKDATVLTIAHRIQTILDSDKIMVLNAGTVEEMDSPANLLKNPDSAFSKLAVAAGVKETI